MQPRLLHTLKGHFHTLVFSVARGQLEHVWLGSEFVRGTWLYFQEVIIHCSSFCPSPKNQNQKKEEKKLNYNQILKNRSDSFK